MDEDHVLNMMKEASGYLKDAAKNLSNSTEKSANNNIAEMIANDPKLAVNMNIIYQVKLAGFRKALGGEK